MISKELVAAQKRPLKGLLRQITLLGCLNAALLVLQIWLLARLMTAVAFDGKTLSFTSVDFYPIVIIVCVRFLLNVSIDRIALSLGYTVTSNIQKELLTKLERLDSSSLASIERGHLSTLMVEGAEKFGTYFSLYLPALFHVALIPVCVLVLIIPMDIMSAVIFILTAPAIVLFMVLIGKGAKQVNQNHWKALSRMGARLQGSLRGLQTLKLFGAAEKEAQTIRSISMDYKSKVMQVLRIAFLSAVVLEFFSTISIALLAVFIGFRLLAGEMAFQDGFLILLLAPEFYQPIRDHGANHHVKMEAMSAADEIVSILNMEEMTFPDEVRQRPIQEGSQTQPKIKFENVAFSYADRSSVLTDVSFEVEEGECVVIAGPSGVGKSTLIHLILGFLKPSFGTIYLNGQTLTEDGRGQWLHEMAWMSQHPHLFDTTVTKNILLGQEALSEDQIKSVLKAVKLEKTIERFPDGLSQRVGEQGRLMSGGEGRRLAIARVLVKGAPILVMDEPSANLDIETEALILQNLRKIKQSKTTMLIAAHREQTLALADRVLFLKDGQIQSHRPTSGSPEGAG